jgi:hypothetical protein
MRERLDMLRNPRLSIAVLATLAGTACEGALRCEEKAAVVMLGVCQCPAGTNYEGLESVCRGRPNANRWIEGHLSHHGFRQFQ